MIIGVLVVSIVLPNTGLNHDNRSIGSQHSPTKHRIEP